MLFRRYCIFIAALAVIVLPIGSQGQQASASAPKVTPKYPAATPLMRGPSGSRGAVSPTDSYYRVMAVVPLVGTGKWQDPMRPDYVPVHKPGDPYRTGIIAYSQVVTDDGKHAIVEMVATSRAAFQGLLNDKRPDVLVFERGSSTRTQMEAGLQRFKKDFNFDKFPRAAVQ